jgi:hypothetical protein
MKFIDTKRPVSNRGVPPDSYLIESIRWCKTAPDEIFAPNPNPSDIYADVKPILGPWPNLLWRRGVMLEAMRVVAGFESSWNFNCGVDTTNQHSLHNIEGQETGIFQVSFDSTRIYSSYGNMKAFAVSRGIGSVGSFISEMKSDHELAFEYFARLSRINIRWDGPLIRHEIDRWLSRDAVAEFCTSLTKMLTI